MGHEGCDLFASKGAKKGVIFTDSLGGSGERTEFSKLSGEGGEGSMVLDGVRYPMLAVLSVMWWCCKCMCLKHNLSAVRLAQLKRNMQILYSHYNYIFNEKTLIL